MYKLQNIMVYLHNNYYHFKRIMENTEFEKVIPDNESSFKASVFNKKHFTSPWHFHPEFEVVMIEQGDGLCFCGDYTGKFYPGDIGVFGKNLPHFYLSDNRFYKDDCKEGCKSIYIQFREEILPADYKHMPGFKAMHHILKESERGISLSSGGNEKLIELIRSLPDIKGFEKVMKLYTLLDVLGKSTEYTLLASHNFRNNDFSQDAVYQKVILYINKHYQREITLEELADIACMNRSALCRRFKKIAGKTIFEFLNEFRIVYACKLIANTDLNISTIAYDCGFNNIAHFNSLFKTHTNHTPKSYRNYFQVGKKKN